MNESSTISNKLNPTVQSIHPIVGNNRKGSLLSSQNAHRESYQSKYNNGTKNNIGSVQPSANKISTFNNMSGYRDKMQNGSNSDNLDL